ncbi:MAG: hypothetical protein DI626_04930 [Micavibrio aeruginosavorus]|uniref:histidine kinase n=1 Tax=Micavibrio aeruginosavorus TaxID=349221 RepID=A0A2W5A0Z9_9BACT|nr:MAG: hypothetical protein DI626_04930 [Micavibrio aeruginosavorus]
MSKRNLAKVVPIQSFCHINYKLHLFMYLFMSMKDFPSLKSPASEFEMLQYSLHVARLSSAMEFVPWGLISVNLSADIPLVVYANGIACQILQKPFAELQNMPADRALSSFDGNGTLDERIRAAAPAYFEYEMDEEESSRWFRVHFIPYGKSASYCLVVLDDITERKVLEGQFFQAQRFEALGELAGGVTHDFNNILSIIDGYARMARRLTDNADVVDCLDKISHSVQRGSALTHQLLSFGRHKGSISAPADLGMMIKDHQPLLSALLDASVQLNFDVAEGIYVDVVPDYISQILFNLCTNARDAMADGGVLSIVMKDDGDEVFLRVSDTGCGMDENVKKRLFQPFFTTKPSGKGTGLGLSIVYNFVREMNGTISVESEQGKGTSFTIRLAKCKCDSVFPDIPSFDDDLLFYTGCTALVAEDEPELLNILCGMLEEMGIRALRAGNGNEALLLQDEYEGKIDFLLTDVVMPELNGVRLAELFGAVRPTAKIMFMSGYPEDGKLARVRVPRGAAMMTKPVDMQKLSSAVKEVMHGNIGMAI